MSSLQNVFESVLNTRLSFVCMVAEISTLKHTTNSGTYICTARLLCPSLHPNTDVEMNIFFHYKNDAPKLRTPGDIGYFRNAVISEYQGTRNLKLDLKNEDSKFALFESSSDSDNPYQKFKITSTTELDLDTARDFARLWIEGNGRFYVSNQEDNFEKIQEEVGHPTDLACKVLCVDKEQDPQVLWVWDGMDTQPRHSRWDDSNIPNLFKDCDLTGSRFHHHPMEVEDPDESLPELGSILPVLLMGWQTLVESPRGWVKFRNVKCMRMKGQLMVRIFLFFVKHSTVF